MSRLAVTMPVATTGHQRTLYELEHRITRAGRALPYGMAEQNTVDVALRAAITECGNAASSLLTRAIQGALGENVTKTAWQLLSLGLQPQWAGAKVEFATYCVSTGLVPLLRAVVDAGAPACIPPDVQPKSKPEWLGLLCARNDFAITYAGASRSNLMACIDLAFQFSGCDITDALELLWEVSPNHSRFNESAAVDDELGAHVKHFLMTKHLTAAQRPANPVYAPTAAARQGTV